MYIIIYNAECDFIRVEQREDVEQEIEELLQDGYALDEIALYIATPVNFSVELEAKVEVNDPRTAS